LGSNSDLLERFIVAKRKTGICFLTQRNFVYGGSDEKIRRYQRALFMRSSLWFSRIRGAYPPRRRKNAFYNKFRRKELPTHPYFESTT
jgi:hypothetical protein